ncbi:MAG: methyltransferase domain-containing protein, partial [Methylococcales bacterium]|nr:methyltransferase domain-containing protein [Methylococcales bacterium]
MDKTKVKRSFSKAVDSYDAMAALQRTVGLELLQLYKVENLSTTVLDIGCGTGFLTGKLLNLSGSQQLIALDLALPMVRETQAKYKDSTT